MLFVQSPPMVLRFIEGVGSGLYFLGLNLDLGLGRSLGPSCLAATPSHHIISQQSSSGDSGSAAVVLQADMEITALQGKAKANVDKVCCGSIASDWYFLCCGRVQMG